MRTNYLGYNTWTEFNRNVIENRLPDFLLLFITFHGAVLTQRNASWMLFQKHPCNKRRRNYAQIYYKPRWNFNGQWCDWEYTEHILLSLSTWPTIAVFGEWFGPQIQHKLTAPFFALICFTDLRPPAAYLDFGINHFCLWQQSTSTRLHSAKLGKLSSSNSLPWVPEIPRWAN
jgi:hypothetical protein